MYQSCLRHLATVTAASLFMLFAGCSGNLESQIKEIRSLQEANKVKESIAAARAALEEYPYDPALNFLLGASLFRRGEISSSIWPLEKAFQREEYIMLAGGLLVQAYAESDNNNQVIRICDAMYEFQPEAAGILFIRGNAKLDSGDHKGARDDARQLQAAEPDNLRALMLEGSALWKLGEMDQAEKSYLKAKTLAEEQENEDFRVHAWVELARLYHDIEVSDPEAPKDRAADTFTALLEAYPAHALVLNNARSYFEYTRQPERISEIIEKAATNYPDRADLQLSYAKMLMAKGEADKALEVLRAADEKGPNPSVQKAIAEHLEATGETKAAAEQIAAIQATFGSSDALRMKEADLLLNVEEREAAIKVIASIKDPAYRDLLNGRLALIDQDYETAYKLLSNAVRSWPNNPLARYNTGIAALALGKREAAAAEFLEATRVDNDGVTDASLALAQMELQQGNYTRGVEFAHRFLAQKGRVPTPEKVAAAHRILIQCDVELERYVLAEKSLKILRAIEGQELAFAVELAGFQKKKNGAKAAVRSLRSTGLDLTDPKNRAGLNILVSNLTALKRTAKAVEAVEAAIEAEPESASLQVLLGEVYLESGEADHAEEAYRKALELNPEEANAQLGLAILMRNRGELEPALKLLQSATALSPSANHYFLTAGVLEQLGRGDEAIEALRLAVEADPGHTAALNNLAWLLAEQGTHLDEALSVAERARRLAGTASVFDTLGWVRYKRGEYLQAERMFKQAIKRQPQPGYYYRLGLVLEKSGKTPKALEAFQKSLQISDQSSVAEEARTAVARLSQAQE